MKSLGRLLIYTEEEAAAYLQGLEDVLEIVETIGEAEENEQERN